eukprot:TRINITY_DN68132_c2_g7_i1.p1 TRINITY_DN68132_c2_g7~~TRINITY_DN68132_c2_g7_i1.p1  ORF type:complete len:446 (+),score=38.48 TRINITY_DN68132_c2_g7_i1:73-1410(+)
MRFIFFGVLGILLIFISAAVVTTFKQLWDDEHKYSPSPYINPPLCPKEEHVCPPCNTTLSTNAADAVDKGNSVAETVQLNKEETHTDAAEAEKTIDELRARISQLQSEVTQLQLENSRRQEPHLTGAGTARAEFLSKRVDQVFRIVHGTYQRFNSHSRLLEMAHPTNRVRKKPVNVAILTPHEGTPNQATQMCSYTKEAYAKLHNYTWILDKSGYAAKHHRHATWNRVPALQKHLKNYDWVLYLDGDIAIANASILLEDFINEFPPETKIAFTDGQNDFNAGAFFIKNDPWSEWLLEDWWSHSNPGDHDKMCHGNTKCKFEWNDQVSLWDSMMEYYAKRSGQQGKVRCKAAPSKDWGKSIDCYKNSMNALGYPYKKRSAYHFYFWPPVDKWPRGFTFFWMDRKALSVWDEPELFHPGDFVIHTHDQWVIEEYSIYKMMKQREKKR